jgi:hypothetical protein
MLLKKTLGELGEKWRIVRLGLYCQKKAPHQVAIQSMVAM